MTAHAAALLLLMAAVSACEATTVAAQRRLANQIVLEFDLPEEYWSKNRQGQFLVSGFLVGYFAPESARPLHTIDIARDAVALYDRVGRIVLPHPRLPLDVTNFVLRLQTISITGSSPWSDASPSVAVPVGSASNGPARGTNVRARASRRALSMERLEEYPQLLAAVREALPVAETRDRVLEPFGSLNELATAVVICKEQQLSLEKVSAAISGPPRRNLRNAVRELKPRLRGTNVLQKAGPAAKRLLEQRVPAQR